DRWPNATLRLDTAEAKGGRAVRGQKLKDLAVAAWAEAFGLRKSSDELRCEQQSQGASVRHEIERLAEKIRAEGAEAWNRIDFRQRARFTDFSGLDLSQANLYNIEFADKDLSGCRFLGASLIGARLGKTKLVGADLTEADLYYAQLWGADC